MMNTAESLNRLRKATAIADMLVVAHGHLNTDLPCSEFARDLSTETRDIVAGAANQSSPSDTTWNEVVRILERRELVAERVDRVACVVEALECVDASSDSENEALAGSFGL